MPKCRLAHTLRNVYLRIGAVADLSTAIPRSPHEKCGREIWTVCRRHAIGVPTSGRRFSPQPGASGSRPRAQEGSRKGRGSGCCGAISRFSVLIGRGKPLGPALLVSPLKHTSGCAR